MEGSFDEIQGDQVQVVVRVENGAEFEQTWNLSPCVELTLLLTLTAAGLAVSRGCTHSTGTVPS